jgi:hypothetical protein
MIFTLEALRAKHGDSLLLHYGDAGAPRLIVIDGGPAGVFNAALRKRLDALRQPDAEEGLLIRLLMVSHIDDDHIRGVLDLTRRLRRQQEEERPLDYDIRTLWHNSFDDIVGDHADDLFTETASRLSPAALAGEVEPPPGLSRPATLVLASVPQGRTLRNDANFLAIAVNQPAGRLITGARRGEAPIDLDDGLTFLPVGPSRQRIRELQVEWDAELERRGLAEAGVEAAAYLDKSIFNLSSIVVLAEAEVRPGEKRRMLLTGDARGDDILTGLEEAGLLDAGPLHVDLLKLPHHGSDRNVETDFFRRVTADHYVVSGDGKHGNPEVATFEMIFAARGGADFHLHLTYDPGELVEHYPIAELRSLFERRRAEGKPFTLHTAKTDGETVRIALGEDA